MTVELYPEAADDAEEVIIALIMPLRPAASFRDPINDPLPFTIVTHIGGGENIDESCAEPIVSVHTLCDKALGFSAAKEETRKTHRRMLWVARHGYNIVLTDGRKANVDWLCCTELPRWEPYGDEQILQKIGRYQFGLTFVAVP